MVGTRNFQNLLLSWSLVTLYTGALTNPVIRFEPEQTVYIVGERLIVRCLANNPTTVSGYIFNKDALTILNTTANILTFSNLKTSDSGLYFCNYYIENENNPFISNFIQLVVIEQPPAPTLLLMPERTLYVKDQSVVLRCELSIGQSSVVTGITLYQNNRETYDADHFGVLNYTNLQIKNTGRYSCDYTANLTRRIIRSHLSNTVNLFVVEQPPPPTLLVMPQRISFVKDQSVVLRCQLPIGQSSVVTGITLYHNNRQTYDSDDFGALNYQKLQIKNTGNYSCDYTSNLTGGIVRSHLSNTVTLIVVELPPTPRLRFAYSNQNQTQQVELACEVQNPSFLQINGYRFYRNGKEIESRPANSFIFNHTLNFAGCYWCRTFVTISGEDILSPKSPEQFLPVDGQAEGQCQETMHSAHILSAQGLKFYGSIIIGKLLVLISVLSIFGVYSLIIQQRKKAAAESQ